MLLPPAMSLPLDPLKQALSKFDQKTSTMAPPLPPSSDDSPTPSSTISSNTIGRVIPRCVVILYYDGDDETKAADKAFVAQKFGVLAENIVSVKVELTSDPKIVAIFVVFKTTEIANFVLRKAKTLAADKDIEFVSAENWLIESAKHLSAMKVHTGESAYHLFYERSKHKSSPVKLTYAPLPKPTDNAHLFELLNRQLPQTVNINVNSGNSSASSTPSSSIFRSGPTTSTAKTFPPSVPTDPSASWGRQPPPLPAQHQYPHSAGPYNPYSQPTSINSPLGWPPMSAPPYPSFGASGSNPMFPPSQGTSSPLFPPNYAAPRPGNGFFSNTDRFNGYPHPFGGAQQYQPPGPRPQQPPPNNYNQFDGSY
uniref:RRM domain-containing protein n=2 Tax=Panagrellus redivivus TaxID=6233 RepID=A0A7E4W493_PANRE